jgi:hypothetical protein
MKKPVKLKKREIDAFLYDRRPENSSLSKRPSERLHARLNKHRKQRKQRNASE